MNTSSQHMNIGRSLARVANENPDCEAIVAADITLSYSKLWRIVRGFATRMREIGINRDSTVAVHSTDMIACVSSMMAASLLGARYVSFENRLLGDGAVKPSHFLRSPDVLPDADTNYHMMDASWPQAAAPDPSSDGSEFAGYADSDDPWWIVHTSGTTGEPKYLSISQRDVYYRSLAVRGDFRSRHSRLCSLFPCNTRPFFARANAALLNACTIVDTIDIAFMQAHGVNLVCGAPRTTMEWLGGRRISPKIPVLQVSGAKLPDADAAFLLQSFETVEDVYGASETNKSFVNVKALAGGQMTTRGKPLDSEVQIVGSDGSLVTAPGPRGSIRIRNNYMATAYIGSPKASEKAFRDGWFYPGDLASWGALGELIVAGRVDEIINLGGVKVDPASIDETLCSVDGISAAAAFRDPTGPTPPRLMAMVTVANLAEANKCVAAAHLACSERFGANVAPRVIIVVPSIPMTGDGAPRRAECQRLALLFMNANNQDKAILSS